MITIGEPKSLRHLKGGDIIFIGDTKYIFVSLQGDENTGTVIVKPFESHVSKSIIKSEKERQAPPFWAKQWSAK